MLGKILAAKIYDNSHMKKQDQDNGSFPRLLTAHEAYNLLKDMKDSSAWARAEIKRRRAARLDGLTAEETQ